ncbi:MAG: hypothetical protein OSJ72_17145 [Lachnospiraceae bacterium]|nr:hypothetical protein [Lachnospiraceae bacterium]
MGEMENTGLNATVDSNKKEDRDAHMPVTPLNETRLKEKYGELYEIAVMVDEDDVNAGRCVRFLFKRPSTASFNCYLKTASKDMMKASGIFAQNNIIEEQAEEFKKECSTYPALALGMSRKLLDVLGLSDNINFRQI